MTNGSVSAFDLSAQTLAILEGLAKPALTFLLLIFACWTISVGGDSLWGQLATPKADEFPAESIEFFETNIRPILVDHCLECHGGVDGNSEKRAAGGLWLNSRAQILEGGDSGPAIVPGKPEDSLLISAVHYEDAEMPPDEQLTEKQIALLEQWVQLGAPDPRVPGQQFAEYEIDIEAGREFWAFRPLDFDDSILSAPSAWAASPIDRFVERQWLEHGLVPNADANRHLLLRRVHLALTGLPPTVEQIAAFTSSTAPLEDDLAEVVDTLLDSPQFGERWGRHWLDVARFAESSGGGRSLMFPHAWRFRDYVIRSFNNDKPFDEFIKEQLAGDLLPHNSLAERNEHIVATGFLVLGPTNYEQQDKELLRMEVIDEQVDTIGRSFLGMTLGCARCHDHKFDPIPTADYYALAGILGSTDSLVDGNVSSYVTRTISSQEEHEAFAAYQRELKQLNAKRAALENRISELGGGLVQTGQRVAIARSSDLPGIVIDNSMAELRGNWTKSVSVKTYIDSGYLHDDGQPKGENQAAFSPKLENGGDYEVRLAYSPGGNRASNTLVIVDHQDGRQVLRVNQVEAPPIDGLFLSLGTYRFEANNIAKVTISNEAADGVVIADAVQFLPQAEMSGELEAQLDAEEEAGDTPDIDPHPDSELRRAQLDFQEIEQALRVLKSNAPRPLDIAMSVEDSKQPADGHVHIRGNVRKLGDVVPRGFLQVVTPPDAWPPIPDGQSGRLQLAEWIADEHNPLTARVYVNRIWRHLFGRGIVESTDNFGSMGTAPSHPQLLDYLASQLIADGWSTKKLIRRIILSRVFRLQTISNPDSAENDPRNELLWRANRRRLDAEVLRDSILFAAGELDMSMGGLTIRKLSQYDLGYQFESRRRSVYVPAFRNSMLDLFEVFDIANPNMVTGHRNTSTLPTQALFLMNSPWVIEQSGRIAARICAAAEDDSHRLELLYLRVVGRPCTESERALANEFLQAGTDADGDSTPPQSNSSRHTKDHMNRWQQLVQAVICSLDFRYIN